jgi:hypothetical protein
VVDVDSDADVEAPGFAVGVGDGRGAGEDVNGNEDGLDGESQGLDSQVAWAARRRPRTAYHWSSTSHIAILIAVEVVPAAAHHYD